MHYQTLMAILDILFLISLASRAQAQPPPLPEQLVESVPIGDAQVWLVETAPAGDRELRVDTFDRSGNRTGYILIDRSTGRFDRFDANSNRTGTGRITPPPASGGAPATLRFDWDKREGGR